MSGRSDSGMKTSGGVVPMSPALSVRGLRSSGDDSETKPKNIGIVACGTESAAYCYTTILRHSRTLLGLHCQPEISLHSHSLNDYLYDLQLPRADDGEREKCWRGIAKLIIASVRQLNKCGADLIVCPNNTFHHNAEVNILPHLPSHVKWISMPDCVAERAKSEGYRKVGVVGTKWTMDSSMYPEALSSVGVECVLPTPHEQEQLHRLIMTELVIGVVTSSSQQCMKRIIRRMHHEDCDAVILGSSSLMKLFGPTTAGVNNNSTNTSTGTDVSPQQNASPLQQEAVLPLLDTVQILAETVAELSCEHISPLDTPSSSASSSSASSSSSADAAAATGSATASSSLASLPHASVGPSRT